MASRSSSTRRTQQREHAESALPPTPAQPDSRAAAAARQPLAFASEAMAQLFRTTANLQMAQQDLVQQAARLYDEAAENLRHAEDLNQIVQIQSHLMTACARAAMECCQDLMLAGVKLGSERVLPQAASVAEPEPHPASSATEAAMNAMAPAMQAWQQFLAMAADNSRTPHH